MDGEENGTSSTVRHNGQNSIKNWGASDALRRNFRSSDTKSDETSRLLGSGSSSDDGRSTEVEWTGYADYKGLSYWRTPTVDVLAPFNLPD